MIAIRTVATDADIDTYLDVRNRVHPETPMPRGAVLEQRRQAGSLDFIAELDGVPVGAASVSKFGGSPDGDLAYLTLRVLREARRQGVGTALDRRASEHANTLGKGLFTVSVRHDDADSLGLGNAPIRLVNEKLGYVRKFEWVHLTGHSSRADTRACRI